MPTPTPPPRQGFLPEEHRKEALKKLEHRAKANTETLVQRMLALDDLPITADMTVLRTKRKQLIAKIEKVLSVGDRLVGDVKEARASLSD